MRSKVRGLKSAVDAGSVIALIVLCTVAFLRDLFLVRAMFALHMNDFGKFYYSARAFLAGENMYGPSLATDFGYGQAMQRVLNLNPPHFHLLILPVAWLEPSQAVALWMAASIFALVLSLLLIGREVGFHATPKLVLLIVLATLAFAGSQAFFLTGQLSLLLMLAMTICWLEARRGRWGRAAVWLGMSLSVKPFLLIFVPYLIGTRRARALAVTVGTAAACFGIGLLIFGMEGYTSWLGALAQSQAWAWPGMNASTLGIFQRVFDTSPLFAPAVFEPRLVPFWPVVAGVIGIATLLVVFEDATPSSTDRAFALLLVAAPLLSPLGWVYYLWLPAGPIAALAFGPDRLGFRLSSASGILAVAAICGLLVPLQALYYLQPRGWATLVLGSAYFWGTLALWIWLLLSFSHARHQRRDANPD